MAEKYPPVRFKAEVKDLLQKRAETIAKERGGGELSLPAYIAEASQFFEDNRPKTGAPHAQA
jgi:hypothetical protein